MGASPPPDRKEFVGRIGTFLVLVGIGLMVFFILSEAAKVPTLSYFCWGTVLLTVGLIFQGQFKRPAGPPHGRFSVLGKIKGAFKPKPKEKKEEKKK
jgi:predicted membrane channel-forming protein YqfA (hemolysin III family)